MGGDATVRTEPKENDHETPNMMLFILNPKSPNQA